MSPDEFHQVAAFMNRRSGIALSPGKRVLAASKLKPVAARFGFKAVPHLVRELAEAGPALARDVVSALTTNETSFFRDAAVFEHFRKQIFPALFHARNASRRVRIWCAAASTGQEPYSLAMIIEEFRPLLTGWTVEILASDIAGDAIARAREGRYDAHEMERGLPLAMQAKYFRREGAGWRIDKTVRGRVAFGIRNLIEPFADLGTFDAIFCRNALIYFDAAAKRDVLTRLQAVLAPDGHLVLGSAETLLGFGTAFSPVKGATGIYARREGARRLAMD
jgi:chemotaxis protein methyltransferase CheR